MKEPMHLGPIPDELQGEIVTTWENIRELLDAQFAPYFGPPGDAPPSPEERRRDLVEQTFLVLLAGRKRSFASLREVTPSERDYFARLWQLARAAVEARG